jgi:predicted nucleotidyltransferase
MRPSEILRYHHDAILNIAAKIGARNVRVFGSMLRGEDTEGSDLDLLVDVPRGFTLLYMVRLQRSLETQLGVSVDLLAPYDLPERFGEQVVGEAKPILARNYATGNTPERFF